VTASRRIIKTMTVAAARSALTVAGWSHPTTRTVAFARATMVAVRGIVIVSVVWIIRVVRIGVVRIGIVWIGVVRIGIVRIGVVWIGVVRIRVAVTFAVI
jgi:hypothetical protein